MEKLTTTYEATSFYLTVYPFFIFLATVAFIDLGLNAQQFNLLYINGVYTNTESAIPDFITLDTWVAVIDVAIGTVTLIIMFNFFIRTFKKIYTFMLNIALILAIYALLAVRIYLGYEVYYFDQKNPKQPVDGTMMQTFEFSFVMQITNSPITQQWLNLNAMYNSYFNFWYISAVSEAVFIASLGFLTLLIISYAKLMALWFLKSEDTNMFIVDEEDKKSLLSGQKQGSSVDLINR